MSGVRSTTKGRQATILAFLADGEPHKFSEFRDYIYRCMDPRVAVRNYVRKFRNHESVPLSEKIEKGRRIAVRETLTHMNHGGLVSIEDVGAPGGEEFTLQLTERGREQIRAVGRAGQGSAVFAQLKRMWAKGDVDWVVTLREKEWPTEEEILNGGTEPEKGVNQ
jgi:hypothetical protein